MVRPQGQVHAALIRGPDQRKSGRDPEASDVLADSVVVSVCNPSGMGDPGWAVCCSCTLAGVPLLHQPTFETARLILHPLKPSDATSIQTEASAREIADTMISLPHPYPASEAERYLNEQRSLREQGRGVAFAIVTKAENRFCGLVEVRDIDREHSQAELSFWLAPKLWGRGCMSEAVQAALRYGFDELGLNRLYAYHMERNPASGRVLEKNGFRREGLLRQRVRKWDRYEDVVLWAIVRSDQAS